MVLAALLSPLFHDGKYANESTIKATRIAFTMREGGRIYKCNRIILSMHIE